MTKAYEFLADKGWAPCTLAKDGRRTSEYPKGRSVIENDCTAKAWSAYGALCVVYPSAFVRGRILAKIHADLGKPLVDFEMAPGRKLQDIVDLLRRHE